MADSLKATFDASEWDKVFAKLKGPVAESLARRMLVSGGVVLRDEAKLQASRPTTHVYNENSRGSHEPGTLADAIYLAFRDKESTPTSFRYSVTWNDKKAWWGKLREFGYHMNYVVWQDKNGVFHTKKDEPLKNPKWIPATPFLRPAFDHSIARVKTAMLDRGRAELPKLLKE